MSQRYQMKKNDVVLLASLFAVDVERYVESHYSEYLQWLTTNKPSANTEYPSNRINLKGDEIHETSGI